MKYYENNELVETTYNIDATIERCSKCPYCEHLSTGAYYSSSFYCRVGQFNLIYCPDDYECYQPQNYINGDIRDVAAISNKEVI